MLNVPLDTNQVISGTHSQPISWLVLRKKSEIPREAKYKTKANKVTNSNTKVDAQCDKLVTVVSQTKLTTVDMMRHNIYKATVWQK